MKFMLLVHHDETAFATTSEAERERMLTESVQLTHQLDAVGQYLSASPLNPASTATIVRVRHDNPIVSDGPFIETKDQIAGYFLVEAKDLGDAIDIAGRGPRARIGRVEIRALIEITGLPAN